MIISSWKKLFGLHALYKLIAALRVKHDDSELEIIYHVLEQSMYLFVFSLGWRKDSIIIDSSFSLQSNTIDLYL